MKKCGGNPLFIAAVLLFAAAITAMCVAFLSYLLLQPSVFSETEHQTFFLAVVMLFAAAFFLVRNTIQSAKFSVEYDEFSLIFQFPGSKERIISWDELSRKVTFQRSRSGWKLVFGDDGQTFFLSRTMRGYRKFLRVLRGKGVLP